MLPTTPVLEPPKLEPISLVIQIEEKKPEPPPPYVVQAGDSLTKIAEAHQTTVERLWSANPSLADPNHLEINQELIIPLNTDVLQPREMPSTIQVSNFPVTSDVPQRKLGSSVSGNTYAPGYCTWYVKNQLGWVKNGWGDAIKWKANAQADGFTVSATPSVGAVAWTKAYSHVSIVRSVDGDTVTVQEMNYKGRGKVSTRVAPISEFLYIR